MAAAPCREGSGKARVQPSSCCRRAPAAPAPGTAGTRGTHPSPVLGLRKCKKSGNLERFVHFYTTQALHPKRKSRLHLSERAVRVSKKRNALPLGTRSHGRVSDGDLRPMEKNAWYRTPFREGMYKRAFKAAAHQAGSPSSHASCLQQRSFYKPGKLPKAKTMPGCRGKPQNLDPLLLHGLESGPSDAAMARCIYSSLETPSIT